MISTVRNKISKHSISEGNFDIVIDLSLSRTSGGSFYIVVHKIRDIKIELKWLIKKVLESWYLGESKANVCYDRKRLDRKRIKNIT